MYDHQQSSLDPVITTAEIGRTFEPGLQAETFGT
jgi:hypothetical protein